MSPISGNGGLAVLMNDTVMWYIMIIASERLKISLGHPHAPQFLALVVPLWYNLITDDDEQVKAPVVKVSDLKGHTSLLRRSVYPTEVRDEDIEDVPTTKEEPVTINQVDSNHRSCQEAARRAVELRRKIQVT